MPGPIGALKWIAPSTVPIQDILTKQMSTCVLNISQQLGKLIFHVFVQLFLRENKTPFVTLSALHHGVCVAGVLHGWGEWHLLPLGLWPGLFTWSFLKRMMSNILSYCMVNLLVEKEKLKLQNA